MSAPSTEYMSYAAFCSGCGHMVAACVDAPDSRKRTAQFVAEWVRDGERIEWVATERVRRELHRCTCMGRQRRAAGRAK